MCILKNKFQTLVKISPLALITFASTPTLLGQTAPLVAGDGVAFGTGDDDPLLRKGSGDSKDLQLDVGTGGVLSMFSGLDTRATFKAGEGNSGTVVAGKWYRIAKSKTRASAVFNLRTHSSSKHGNVTFRMGMAYNTKEKMAFTLLSNSRYNLPVFSHVRCLSKNTYDEYYLEVKIAENAVVDYSIMENLAAGGGWQPIDWVETTSIPTDYHETVYELDKLFVVAGQSPVLSVDRNNGVAITGDLKINQSPVLTVANLRSNLTGSYAFGSSTIATGARSMAFGYQTKALGGESLAVGRLSEAIGLRSVATGYFSQAVGSDSIAVGYKSEARGDRSVAFGNQTKAIGMESLATGRLSEARGERSMASGYFSQSVGVDSLALGHKTEALGARSVAFGNQTKAIGMESLATGKLSEARGRRSMASGYFSQSVGVDSLALGHKTEARGGRSVAFGNQTKAIGNDSFALGYRSESTGHQSIASGHLPKALGNNSIAVGGYVVARGNASATFGNSNDSRGWASFTSGRKNITWSSASAVFGSYNNAYNPSGFVVGQFNEGITENQQGPNSWQGNDLNSVLEVGIGTAEDNRRNALTVMQDGSVEVGKDAVTNEIPLKVKSDGSVILSKPQGDISMGIYGQP